MESDAINDIVTFWMGSHPDDPEAIYARRDWWYKGGEQADAEIRDRFGELVPRACQGQLTAWRETPEGSLALVLLLDQFTRNLFRGTPDAWRGDTLAFQVMNHAIDSGLDIGLSPVERVWLYHPFHHSEDIAEQDRGLGVLRALRDGAPEKWHRYLDRSIWGWTRHRDIVARFGRFPHRNVILKRPNTPEEEAFLAENNDNFGQALK